MDTVGDNHEEVLEEQTGGVFDDGSLTSGRNVAIYGANDHGNNPD